jgi:nucleotidyltransferase substrate binding protein (TIGR01987 family)
MTRSIDLTSLSNAVARLAEGLERYQRDVSDTQIRDGLIQRFEFTYELAHKMLKRYLESVSPSPGEYDAADFQYLIRSTNEQDLLLGDWPTWRKYRDMRGKTSHTYDEGIALEVVAGIAPFLEEARHLLQQITSRLHV